MRRGKTATACFLAALMLLPAVAASADGHAERDEDLDRFMFLDIAEVSHRHDGRSLIHRISTHEAWATEDLDNRSKIFFKFSFDNDSYDEREVRVDVEDGVLSAVMYSGANKRITEVEVTRPDDRSVRIRFLPRLLKPDISHYTWRTKTIAHGCDDPNTETNPLAASMRCFDYAPNDRHDQVAHRL